MTKVNFFPQDNHFDAPRPCRSSGTSPRRPRPSSPPWWSRTGTGGCRPPDAWPTPGWPTTAWTTGGRRSSRRTTTGSTWPGDDGKSAARPSGERSRSRGHKVTWLFSALVLLQGYEEDFEPEDQPGRVGRKQPRQRRQQGLGVLCQQRESQEDDLLGGRQTRRPGQPFLAPESAAEGGPGGWGG